MPRRITNNHKNLDELQIIQYKANTNGDLDLIKADILKNKETFDIHQVASPYYIEFQMPSDCRYTINWGGTYGIEVATVKDHEHKPNMVRVIFGVTNLKTPFTNPDKNGDVDVTPPNDVPFVE